MELVEPTAIAYLRGGPWAATQTALATMASRGQLVTGPPGRIQRTGPNPPLGHTLERALYSDLYAKVGAREASIQPSVSRALQDIRTGLERDGFLRPKWRRVVLPVVLLGMSPLVVGWLANRVGLTGPAPVLVLLAFVTLAGWFIPRRTAAGARALRAARRRYAHLAKIVDSGTGSGSGYPPEMVGIAVALFGNAALHTLLPRIAADAGLLDGGKWTPIDVEPAPRNRWNA